jgi:hypothetical protein
MGNQGWNIACQVINMGREAGYLKYIACCITKAKEPMGGATHGI